MSLLSERWRLGNHPLYSVACKRLQLSPPAEDGIVEPLEKESSDAPAQTVFMEAYNMVVYPSKSDLRYSSLMQDCKKIVAVAQDNPRLFRRLKVTLSQFLASVNDREQRYGHAPRHEAPNHDMATVRAPVSKTQKRGRPSSEDNQNLSNLCRKKQQRAKTCSLCKQHGVDAADHRKGSRCPFYPLKV